MHPQRLVSMIRRIYKELLTLARPKSIWGSRNKNKFEFKRKQSACFSAIRVTGEREKEKEQKTGLY